MLCVYYLNPFNTANECHSSFLFLCVLIWEIFYIFLVWLKTATYQSEGLKQMLTGEVSTIKRPIAYLLWGHTLVWDQRSNPSRT